MSDLNAEWARFAPRSMAEHQAAARRALAREGARVHRPAGSGRSVDSAGPTLTYPEAVNGAPTAPRAGGTGIPASGASRREQERAGESFTR